MTGIERAVVSPEEAKAVPYPYVYVENDGSVRELHAEERAYLEEPFHPTDGGQPYVKWRYRSRDGWGDLQGYCQRSKVPRTIVPQPAPAESPHRVLSTTEIEDFLRSKELAPETRRRRRRQRWLRSLGGLVILLVSLPCAIGSAIFVLAPSRDRLGTMLLGGIMCAASLWIVKGAIRMLLDRPR